MADRRGQHVLEDLDELSHSVFQTQSARRTASLAIPRSTNDEKRSYSMPRSHRVSMSTWNSDPKSQIELDDDDDDDDTIRVPLRSQQTMPGIVRAETSEKKGIWSWKPMRALSHIRMQRISCLLSVEVVAVRRLPATMDGMRLSVSVHKKETRDGAVRTMPSRVLKGAADFEEALFVKCHVYCSGGGGTGKPLKFESRLFQISAVAVDAREIDFGKSTIDLSLMVKESMDKNLEGSRVRQWDTIFPLSGKAKGGELVLKLGFQIMGDRGVDVYSQEGAKLTGKEKRDASFSYARRRSRGSFSAKSPRVRSSVAKTDGTGVDLEGIDEFSLDEPVQHSESLQYQKLEPELKDDLEVPDFDVVENGVEIQEDKNEEVSVPIEGEEEAFVSNEVVKEVVHDSAQVVRLNELDSIAQQIKALESMMIGDELGESKDPREEETPGLDADEDAVTREFLQMLEQEDKKEASFGLLDSDAIAEPGKQGNKDGDKNIYFSDLGKGLRSVVQTRDGGYLCAMNPFDVEVKRKDVQLAMQVSKPFIFAVEKMSSGLEVFQRLAAIGSEKLCANLQAISAMDELMGKTAEQIAFEGMATSIITGRNKERASSSAAKTVAALKTMATELSEGRNERITTGIWNVREEPVAIDEIVTFSLQKIESMAVEALKIQAGIAEDEAPFDVSALAPTADSKHPLDSAVPPEDWERPCSELDSVAIIVIIQLRDPLRRYETVGAPSIAVIQAERVAQVGKKEEGKYKVFGLHVGGLKLQSGVRRSIWDGEKPRLTALQWLVAYGIGKTGKKKPVQIKGECNLLWSLSSRVMADMWLKAARNPNVKVPEK